MPDNVFYLLLRYVFIAVIFYFIYSLMLFFVCVHIHIFNRYPDEVAGQIPMAFVVRQPGSSITENQIMDFVAKQVLLA